MTLALSQAALATEPSCVQLLEALAPSVHHTRLPLGPAEAREQALGSRPPGVLIPRESSLPDPTTVLLAREGQTTVAAYEPASGKKTIGTVGLSTCAAVVIYDRNNRVGLTSHLFVALPGYENPALMTRYVAELRSRFEQNGGNWGSAEVTVVWGYGDRATYLPRIRALGQQLEGQGAGSVRVDARVVEPAQNYGNRNVFLDLENGRVFEAVTGDSWQAVERFERAADSSRSRVHPEVME